MNRERLITCIKIMLVLVLALAAFSAVCFAEEETYDVDLPGQITVGLGERIGVNYHHPRAIHPGCMELSCSDPDALEVLGNRCYVANWTREGTMNFRMLKKGQFTLTFSAGGEFTYQVNVTVDDLAYLVLPHDSYIVQLGQTIPTGIALAGGTRYNGLSISYSQFGLVSFSADRSEMTGIAHGYTVVTVLSGNSVMGTFTVLVVDPCEGVQISTEYDRATIGLQTGLNVRDSAGNRVCARLEVTEGGELVNIGYNQNAIATIIPDATGWVTVTAYGTDGSTDSVRLQVFDAPETMTVEVPTQTIAAGEPMQVSVTFPEGCWAPAYYYLFDQKPNDTDITGTVALLSDEHVFTGVMTGTVRLYVQSGSLNQSVNITVTDSDAALHIDRPEYGFDWRTPYQLRVTNGAGQNIPAVYSNSGNGKNIRVSPEGLLTADGKYQMTVYVTVTDDISYSFSVHSVECPEWLEPEADVMVLPLNIPFQICNITADINISLNDIKVTSSDESVVTVENNQLVPQKIGSALVTVWSRYCDVNCHVLVVVEEPVNKLYMNGTADEGEIFLPYNRTVKLPTLTNYYGNTVNVTWRVDYEYVPQGTYGSSTTHSVSLLSGNKIKGLVTNGYALLIGKAGNGVTFRLNVQLYQSPTSCWFDYAEETWTVGSTEYQIDLRTDGGSGISDLDVAYTLTGDTECVIWKQDVDRCLFTCVNEGTVTLTARLSNGKTATTVIHVQLSNACKNGHDPRWVVTDLPGTWWYGRREYQCSRCWLCMGEETIPCTGELSFEHSSVYLTLDGRTSAQLGAALDGSQKESFTITSSNPDVVYVLGDTVFAVSTGEAVITLSKGVCTPVYCTVRVLEDSMFVLPDGISVIEEGAFQYTSITSAIIPDGVTRIESATFANCEQLAEVCIPDSVTYIAENAFSGSPNVTIVCSDGSYAATWAESHSIPRTE